MFKRIADPNAPFLLNGTNVEVLVTPESGSWVDGKACIVTVSVKPGALAVDRMDVHAWSVGKWNARGLELAKRLKAAVLAGAAFDVATIKVDANGKRYVAATPKIFGRTMDASLTKLGF